MMELKKSEPFKSLKSIPKPQYTPINERSSITISMLSPGMDLSDYVKDSHLVFLDYVNDGETRYNKRRGLFKCSLCGTVIERCLVDVVRGSIRSCGCMGKYHEIKPGEKYGYLTVLDEDPLVEYYPVKNRKTNKVYSQKTSKLPVLCDCGNKTYADPRELRIGAKKTCGKCYHPEIPDSYIPELHAICKMLGKRYDKIRARTQSPDCTNSWVNYALRGVKLEITLHDFIRAYYKQNIDFKHMQVDRIDGMKSYTLDNIRWVSPNDNMQNTIKPDMYTNITVSYRLFTDGKFQRVCAVNKWVYDNFIKIPFPFYSDNGYGFNLYVDKFGPLKPVQMVYHYIYLMKNVSDNMTTDTNKKYLTIVDKDGCVVPELSAWSNDYKVKFI